MSDFNGLLKSIKRAAVEAVATSKPTEICYGSVTGIAPLEINIDQKLTLGLKQLILLRNTTAYDTKCTIDWGTEEMHLQCKDTDLTHAHELTGEKTITIHNGLCVGDQVMLLRVQGGQKYMVLDRIAK